MFSPHSYNTNWLFSPHSYNTNWLFSPHSYNTNWLFSPHSYNTNWLFSPHSYNTVFTTQLQTLQHCFHHTATNASTLTGCFLHSYKRFNDLKLKKPGLKTLLAVGGFTARSEGFSAMSATSANRQQFVSSAISWLREHNFDGLDIDWEYPGHAGQGGRPEDKANFALLVQVCGCLSLISCASGLSFHSVSGAFLHSP